MMARRGFTLLEVTIALVVTGLVVTTAYAVAQAGLDTGDRLTTLQSTRQAAYVTHALLADALRHAVPGIRGGAAVFSLTDRSGESGAPADSLDFLSRGVVSPFGSGDAWRVSVWSDGEALRLEARPVASTGDAPVRARVSGSPVFDVRALPRGETSDWRAQWEEADLTPDAVRIAAGGARGEMATHTVVRLGLERQP